jgi:lipoyl(octanoyl) transferase
VLTLGRNAHRSNILASDEMLAKRGVTIHEINRGGDVTYHGPGQLVGYPIFDLRSLRNPNGGRMGPVDFVRLMEEALIRLCAEFGVRAGRMKGLTGVWCGVNEGSATPATVDLSPGTPAEIRDQGSGADSLTEQAVASQTDCAGAGRKIGAIGIHVSRGITSHGFAFNVTTDLRDFALIVPCGIPYRPVTSLAQEVQKPDTLPNLEAVAHRAARNFGLVFSRQVLAVESLAALCAQVVPAPEFPAEDTPLQVPPEVERLRGNAERPVRA